MSQSSVDLKLAHIKGIERRKQADGLPCDFVETLKRTAIDFGDKGIQMRDRSGRRFERWTYAELRESVGRYVSFWRGQGVAPGDRILLCLNTSWEFVNAWLGAICMGARPAAIAPTAGGLKGSSHFSDRLENFRSVIGASRLLISDRMARDLREADPSGMGALALTLEELQTGSASDSSMVEASPDDMAFLQFTSGSTGTPRAVQIHHGMAMHNAFAINEGIGHRYGAPADEWVEMHNTWLPMHHDMGLIGCLLLAIANGIELSLMNPSTFLSRPFRYLETAHKKRVLLSGPNFGYQFCVDRLTRDDLKGVDLSRVGVAMTGSEMIRPETMEAFCELVAETGFTPDEIMPCYGMAEATLAVAFDGRGEGVRTASVPYVSDYLAESQNVVCVGLAVPDTEVAIVDSSGSTLAENQLGEIQVKGPAVFKGYFGNETATDESKRGDWLRTGDLGFILGGELYIAGRSKEILVIRGDNVMPHEIEWLAEEGRGDSKGAERIAAFSVSRENAGEEIALVVETHLTEASDLHRLDHAIRSRIGRGMSLTISDLAFVRRGRIPRTSSGKIQRSKMKREYLEGSVERLDLES